MFEKLEKFFTSLGTWNHAGVIFVLIWPIAILFWIPSLLIDDFPPFYVCIYFAGKLLEASYYGREVTAAQRSLRGLDAFNMKLWYFHDRNQQIKLMFISNIIGMGVNLFAKWQYIINLVNF